MAGLSFILSFLNVYTRQGSVAFVTNKETYSL